MLDLKLNVNINKFMKNLILISLMLFVISCGQEDQELETGLNLKTLPNLVKNSKSVQEIEERINEPDGINNVDLNNDGEVDYIYVTESKTSDGDKFEFHTYSTGETIKLAEISLNQLNDKVNYVVSNNYHQHQGSFGFTEFVLLYYLTQPNRVIYVSPYSYRYSYPATYHRQRRVTTTIYKTRTVSKQAPVVTTSKPNTTSTSKPSVSAGSKTTTKPSSSTSKPSTTSRPSSTSSRSTSSKK